MNVISVIIPVYNAGRYLGPCIDSVLGQTYSGLELILVDDGSTDGSGGICDAYARKDARVRVIHQTNAGVAVARNRGLDAATGAYITFADSDDYLEPCMYEKMMEKAEAFSCDLVLCDCEKVFADHRELYSHPIRGGFYDFDQLKREYYPHLLVMPNVEYPATISNYLCLFRSTLSREVRYLEGVRYSEDWLFGCQLMRQARSFYYMKGEAYYHYRIHDTSATHRFVPDKWEDYKKLFARTKAIFEAQTEYDFSRQLDLMLLFLVYNAVGDVRGAAGLTGKEKRRLMGNILGTPEVKAMFRRLSVRTLAVPRKLKLLTGCYQMGSILSREVENHEKQ